MIIYDPPLSFAPLVRWREYLASLKKDPAQHAAEIAKTEATIAKMEAEEYP